MSRYLSYEGDMTMLNRTYKARADRRQWAERWPHFCRECGGVGRKGGAPCITCRAKGICSRCGALGTLQESVCTACGWDGSDTWYEMFRCQYPQCHEGPRGGPGFGVQVYCRTTRRNVNRYCCHSCAYKAKVNVPLKIVVQRKKRLSSRACEACGTIFQPERSNQRFCRTRSPKCGVTVRVTAANQARGQRKIHRAAG